MIDRFDSAVLDAYIKLALEEDTQREMQSIPPKEELDRLYPIPKRNKRKLSRAIKEHKYHKPLYAVYLQRVAMIILVCFVTAAGGLLTNQNVRASVRDTVLEWCSKYVKFHFEASEDYNNFPTAVKDVEIQYIPDGFNIEYQDEAVDSKQFIYFNEEGDELVIDIMQNNVGAIMVDNEHQTYEELVINGRTVHFFYSDEENSGIGVVGNNK